mgnify:CR=1 FL=1|tara:strand:+ start:4113 stop:4958 length:846 start_codon:yes stop_codon:yes gene_type:complete
MNYLLIYLGESPDYIKYTINSILSVDKNSKVYFCSDKKVKYKNIEYINSKEVLSSLTKKVQELNIYKNTNYEINPLWASSFLRIFYLYDLAKSLSLNSFVHFDADVLIYKPFEALSNHFDKEKFNITPLNEDELIFGYTYTENLSNYKKIVQATYEFVNNKDFEGEGFNEMKILNKIFNQKKDFFNLLPVTPERENTIFDPASYGQYLGGTDKNPKKLFSKPWAGSHHYVGREILNGNLNVKFKNKSPYVVKNKSRYDLANLHVHSKRLEKYLPNGYKEYI